MFDNKFIAKKKKIRLNSINIYHYSFKIENLKNNA